MNADSPIPIRLLVLALSVAMLGACGTAPSKPAPTDDVRISSEKVTADVDRDVNAALLAGEFAWQDGRGASAAKHYVRAAELSADPKIAAHAARVALAAKEWELARTAIRRWKSLDAEAPGIRQADAAISLLTGDFGSAEAALLEFLEGGDEGRKLAAQVLIGSADPDAVIAAVEKLSARKDLPGGADSLVLLSQVAQQLKRDVLATAIAEKAVARFPQSPQAWTWRGHTKLRSKDNAAARADFERAVALDPKSRELRLTYAAVLNELGDAAGAARTLESIPADDEVLAARAAYAARADDPALLTQSYEALTMLPPPHPAARLELLGQMAELAKRRDDALRWYREVPRGEHFLDAQMRIAVLLDESGQRDEALAHLEALRAAGIDDDEKLAESYLLEAELQLRRERRDLALAAYDRGLKSLPDERRLLYGRALAYEQMDRVADAERDLRRVLELNPEDPDALNALGYTLADRTDKHEEAHALIARALELKPDEPAIIDSMGWVEYRRGNHEASIRHLKRAYELQPDAEIAAHLGEVLWVTGAKAEARKVWAEGTRKDAKNSALKRTIERFKP
ncbi:MAG TPA: tetratricopeptide repeat protein [Candidatus Saccharimonadia bacterium]|nr:tetratricopeptide repeat protein [Candidatus Saccharimonadia bacterium]